SDGRRRGRGGGRWPRPTARSPACGAPRGLFRYTRSVLALQASGLTKTYRGLFGRAGQPALQGLDLEIPLGTAFGLVGPHGARELEAAVARVGLADAAGRRIGGFSKGMRQRVGLAAAMLGGPELLVLDEPTDGVDPLGRVEVRHLLAEERSRGATLFLNSHLL